MMKKENDLMKIVYMGTPEFAVAPLDALLKNGYNVVGVVTVADKASGRGLKVNESAVKKYAVEHKIPVLQPVSLKDPEFLEALRPGRQTCSSSWHSGCCLKSCGKSLQWVRSTFMPPSCHSIAVPPLSTGL